MRVATERRDLLVAKGWIQAVTLVVLFGFLVMGLLAYRADYTADYLHRAAQAVTGPAPTTERQ
jgi:hypothetical protein